MVSLMLTLFATQSSAESEVKDLLRTEENPAGETCFSKEEMHSLAKFKLKCDVTTLDRASIQDAYSDCMSKSNAPSMFSSTPAILGYVATALILGFSAGRK